MGLTQKLGTIPLAILTDTSNNVGIGGSPSGSYKLEVTGTAKVSSTLLVSGQTTFTSANNGKIFGSTGATTGYQYAEMTNTGGIFNMGVAGSTGVIWASGNGGAYNSVIGTANATDFVIGTNNIGRMMISSSGNIGIGTTTPSAKLHVYGQTFIGTPDGAYTQGTLKIGYGTGGYAGALYLNADNNTGGAYIAWNAGIKTSVDTATFAYAGAATKIDGQAGILKFYTAATGTAGADITWNEGMRIDNNGRLSIGSSSYGAATIKIMAYQTADQHVISSYATTGNANACFFARVDSTTNVFNFFSYGATIIGSISTSAGTSVSYNTTYSDKRLKKNFESWDESVINSFKDINPQKYNLNNQQDSDERIKGFIAQEMVDKFPEAYPIDNDGFYCFNPSGMVVYLTKAIQELSAQVQEQNQTIQSLQERITKGGL